MGRLGAAVSFVCFCFCFSQRACPRPKRIALLGATPKGDRGLCLQISIVLDGRGALFLRVRLKPLPLTCKAFSLT